MADNPLALHLSMPILTACALPSGRNRSRHPTAIEGVSTTSDGLVGNDDALFAHFTYCGADDTVAVMPGQVRLVR